MVFSCIKDKERTDEEFRNYMDQQHHKSRTILTENAFVTDMIHSFPIDAMHGLDLGIMKKILHLFISKKFFDPSFADSLITNISKFVPSDFARRPRSLKFIDHYKATEYRLFALYLGPVVFKLCGVQTCQYNNFLNFFVSYRILMGEDGIVEENNCKIAELLLQNFVTTFHLTFEELSYNFHNLLHLGDVVRKHGPLDKYSAYKYENFYFLLRSWIRKPSHIFEQIYTRWTQTRGCVTRKVLKRKTFGKNLLDSSVRNNCVMTANGDIFIITKKSLEADGVSFQTKKFRNREIFFSTPVCSSTLHIYIVSDADLVDGPTLHYEQVVRKMFRIPFKNDQFVIMPVLHY